MSRLLELIEQMRSYPDDLSPDAVFVPDWYDGEMATLVLRGTGWWHCPPCKRWHEETDDGWTGFTELDYRRGEDRMRGGWSLYASPEDMTTIVDALNEAETQEAANVD